MQTSFVNDSLTGAGSVTLPLAFGETTALIGLSGTYGNTGTTAQVEVLPTGGSVWQSALPKLEKDGTDVSLPITPANNATTAYRVDTTGCQGVRYRTIGGPSGGSIAVSISAAVQDVLTLGTVAQGTGGGINSPWSFRLSDGTTGPAAVTAASTGAALTDKAVVTSKSPNNGGSKYRKADLGAKQAMKASAGVLKEISIDNETNAPVYVQLFDAANAGVTLGTSTDWNFRVNANTQLERSFPDGLPFGTAITIGATTVAPGGGATAAGAGVFVTALYF